MKKDLSLDSEYEEILDPYQGRTKFKQIISKLRKENNRLQVCTCLPIPYIDWCESCVWKEIGRLEEEIETLKGNK